MPISGKALACVKGQTLGLNYRSNQHMGTGIYQLICMIEIFIKKSQMIHFMRSRATPAGGAENLVDKLNQKPELPSVSECPEKDGDGQKLYN